MIIEIIIKSSAREENSDCLQDAEERRELIYTINISLGLGASVTCMLVVF